MTSPFAPPMFQKDHRTSSHRPEVPAGKETISDENRPYQHADADVILVSAKDELKFRVHSYHLMTSSHFFKDMLYGVPAKSNAAPKVIALTDGENETAPVVRLMLDCFYGRWSDVFSTKKVFELSTGISATRLFDKYICSAVMENFVLLYKYSLDSQGLHPFTAFVIGAYAKRSDLCVIAIAKAGGWQREFYLENRSLSDGVAKGNFFDLRCTPRREYLLIPSEYAHALLRATLAVQINSPGDIGATDWLKVSSEFRRLWSAQEELEAISREPMW